MSNKGLNNEQYLAASPDASVWVNASAGTGKTTVLTERVMRLLLSGNDPLSILCITYTKAGASEMAERIQRELIKFALASDSELEEALSRHFDTVDDALKTTARNLFAKIVDLPNGLNILTLHSFCQMVLKKFPLEIGLAPYFEVLDEQNAYALLTECLHQVLSNKGLDESNLSADFAILAQTFTQDKLYETIFQIIAERSKLFDLKNSENWPKVIHKLFQTSQEVTAESLLKKVIAAKDNDKLKALAKKLLMSSKKRDITLGEVIAKWAAIKNPTPDDLKEYQLTYLTQEGVKKKQFYTKEVAEIAPELETEAEAMVQLYDASLAIKLTQTNISLISVTLSVLELYTNRKKERSLLDFADLIFYTRALLNTVDADWILYKLDSAINHILVDEAQDTNSAQWDIVKKLSEDFFSGQSFKENVKPTLFVVGDEKQSIYSFQGADLKAYEANYQYLFKKSNYDNSLNCLKSIELATSYRSSPVILNYVDAVFSSPEIRKGVSLSNIKHTAHNNYAGYIEIWPVLSKEKPVFKLPCEYANETSKELSASNLLANKIAKEIKSWIDNRPLQATGNLVKADDILILLRKRGIFMEQIIKALKSEKVPVSGIDRLKLLDQLAVLDMLALAEFILLPDNDLNLANFLKSPLIGVTEEELFNIAYNRTASLYDALNHYASSNAKLKIIRDYLDKIMDMSEYYAPYEFFSKILNESCPASAISGKSAFIKRLGDDALDALDEFLNSCFVFERLQVPSLKNFLAFMRQDNSEIKREMDKIKGKVRIMTVHGAKGLEAPIVILPDTLRRDQNDNLIWLDIVPIWLGAKKNRPSFIESFYKEQYKKEDEQESKRLFYVALTRAKYELYICGFSGKVAKQKDSTAEAENTKEPTWYSWYDMACLGAKTLKNTTELKVNEEHFDFAHYDSNWKGQGYKIFNTDFAVKENNNTLKQPENTSLQKERIPPCLFEKDNETIVPKVIIKPSQLFENGEDVKEISPCSKVNEYAFERGTIVHKLLELLPDIATAQREELATKYLKTYAKDFSQTQQQNILNDVIGVINNPSFKELFSPLSQSEVAIAGNIDKNSIKGKIDRLLITDNEVIIVDYKTNITPAKNINDVPKVYINQLNAYKQLLQQIYPDKIIKSYILWTTTLDFMPI